MNSNEEEEFHNSERKMSGKLGRNHEDEDSEVGDRDRHRRNVQSDRGRSRSSPTSKKARRDEENVGKELIEEFAIDSNRNSTRKEEKSVVGSKELDNLYASYLPSSDYYERSYMHR